MDISLDQLKPGMDATVTAIACQPGLRARLADFGLIAGTRIHCRYESPGKDIKAIALRGSVLAIRTADLAGLTARVL